MYNNDYPRRPMDRFDDGVLRLALAWLPYGGADADATYDALGLSPEQYSRFVLDVLDRCDLPQISGTTKLELRRIAFSVLDTKKRIEQAAAPMTKSAQPIGGSDQNAPGPLNPPYSVVAQYRESVPTLPAARADLWD